MKEEWLNSHRQKNDSIETTSTVKKLKGHKILVWFKSDKTALQSDWGCI